MANHIPYGYRIENGTAVIDEVQSGQVRTVFQEYLSGRGLMDAAKAAGLTMFHSGVKRMLRNRYYLGDAFYPQLIDEETFQRAEEELIKRAEALGRIREQKEPEEVKQETCFTLKKTKKRYADPFKQAAYIYSLIEGGEGNG